MGWKALRETRLADVRSSKELNALKDHRENLIYWGCIAADKALTLLPFAKEWTIVMSKMAGHAPTEGRTIKFRIYRDYDALRSYQISGIESLRSKLLGP
jgi:hypothetical protein